MKRLICWLRGHRYAATRSIRWYTEGKVYTSQRLVCLRCCRDGLGPWSQVES